MRFEPRPSIRPKQILVVEDNPADVRLLRYALDQMTSVCKLSIAADGAEAIRLLAAADREQGDCPDLVLLDLNLPLVSGHDVLQQIKSDPKTKSIPVIVMSSSASPDDVNRAYREYANCYVRKPTSLDDYLGVVRMLEGFWLQVASLPSCA